MTSSNKDPEEWHDIIGNKAHKEEVAVKFKNNDDPLKIAIVVDMWLTGFDVPSLATMYVYKPMNGHNLMQAIARVNRVYKNKEGGLVVDYIGIAQALKEAMNDYTIRDKKTMEIWIYLKLLTLNLKRNFKYVKIYCMVMTGINLRLEQI